MKTSVFIESLRKELPPVFTRRVASQMTGGFLSIGALANLDSKGQGPVSAKAGKRILYEKEAFLEWLATRLEKFNDRVA